MIESSRQPFALKYFKNAQYTIPFIWNIFVFWEKKNQCTHCDACPMNKNKFCGIFRKGNKTVNYRLLMAWCTCKIVKSSQGNDKNFCRSQNCFQRLEDENNIYCAIKQVSEKLKKYKKKDKPPEDDIVQLQHTW